jgi:hypothetical protein
LVRLDASATSPPAASVFAASLLTLALQNG